MSSSSLSNGLYKLGLVLVAVSYCILRIKKAYFPGQDFFDEGSYFWLNYVICIVYFIAIHFYNHSIKNWRIRKVEERLYSNSLILFSISAHSLNTELQVFAPYVEWFDVLIFIMHLAWLAFPYRHNLPYFAEYGLYMLCGLGLAVSIYMSIFMLPLIIFGMVFFWFLGIPAHATITLWYAYTFASYAFKKMSRPQLRGAYLIGISLAVLFTLLYLIRWNQVQTQIEAAQENWKAAYHEEIPQSLVLAQQLPKSYFTRTILLSQIQNPSLGLDRFSFSRTGRDEVHDPLSFIGRLFCGRLKLNRAEVLSILKSQYGEHHLGIRRLWRGDELRTTKVESDIHIYPAYRMAYTQKSFWIKNENESRWRGRQQEAAYTFHLPDGAVVTSLSLWVDGKERKSRLSTRSKADSAYVKIVGVERRDPALLHWQEGNQVTVTVFPCTPQAERVFKIGMSMPLRLEGEELVLEDFYFQGPPPVHTQEIMRVSFEGDKPEGLDLPFRLREQKDGSYLYQGKYLPNRRFSFQKPLLGKGEFRFNGKSVFIEHFTPEAFSFSPQEIIVDLNTSWTRMEWMRLWKQITHKDVFVFTPQKTRVTADNQAQVFEQLKDFQFSLLPIHQIESPRKSLIISKSPTKGPILSQLDGTPFAQKLQEIQMKQDEKPKFFNISHELSPYWQAFKAFDQLAYASGSLDELLDLLEKKQFWTESASGDAVILSEAKIKLICRDTAISSPAPAAPDHLFRLFAYNDLLRDIGRQYFDRQALEDQWLRQAEEAFVVSPVTSLIVLETDYDYKRFEIAENENSLENATIPPQQQPQKKKSFNKSKGINQLIGSGGATPEPHEWVLILLVGALALWQLKKTQF